MKPSCRPFAAVLVLLTLPGSLGAAEVVDRVLVFVNSRIISESALDARMEQTIRDSGVVLDAKRREEMKKTVLEELVNESLLEDRARDLDLTTADAEVEEQVNRLKELNKVTTEEDFAKALAASGLTPERLREQARKTLTVQRVVGREVNSKVDLSDDALRVIYEREKETYRVPEKAHLAEILVSKGDDAAAAQRKAKEASDLLKTGVKFEAVVAQYSDGSTKDRGGDLGIMTKGELNPEIDKIVFSLAVGAVSDPIGTKFGWHIVRVVEKVPPTYKPFSEVKAEILKREQETQFQKKLAEYLDKLKTEAVIKVSPEAQAYYAAPARAASAAQEVSRITTTGVGTGMPVTKRRSRIRGIEITPMAGWRFGGTTSTYGSDAIDRVKIPSAPSFGLTAEFPLKDFLNAELLWSHQDTELKVDVSGLAPEGTIARISHLNVDTLQIGAVWQSGGRDDQARLYVELLLGASLLTPAPQFSSLTRFSMSIGGGIKVFASDHFGARLGARWMPVYINSKSDGTGYCDPVYGCYLYYNTNLLSQGDAALGAIFRF